MAGDDYDHNAIPKLLSIDNLPIQTAFRTKEQFWVGGISDKVLDRGGRIRYLQFWEIDGAYMGWPVLYPSRRFREFRTPNGWHIIGDRLVDARGKKRWFNAWREVYPDSDYILAPENVLAPHSDAEVSCIYRALSQVAQWRVVKYYRDKAVFETWQMKLE